MRRRGIIFPSLVMLVFGVLYTNFYSDSTDNRSGLQKYLDMDPNVLAELPKYDRPDLAVLQDFEMTKDPALGYPPSEKLLRIADQLSIEKLANSALGNPTTGDWTERGPNNFGGRTRAVMFDPNDPFSKKLWSAGVAGGLWYNEDITSKYSSWTKVNDFFGNMAINSMAYDPQNTSIFYFGTGEGWFNADAVRGNGIWKSNDGGVTWSQLESTADAEEFFYIQKIAVTDQSTVLISSRDNGGIYRSTDGGESWDRVVTEVRGADIEVVGSTIYASTGIFSTGKLWRSEDDGVTWQDISPGSFGGRIEIGTHPNHKNTVYAAASDGSVMGGFYRSFDKGDTWENVSIPPYTEQSGCPLSTSNDFTRGQAWYDLIIGVDPMNRNVLTVGGIDIYKSSDAGDNWDLISYWTGECDVYVHADQHNFIWRPGFPDHALAATDGGIYYTSDFSTSIEDGGPSFEDRNLDYNVAQFYSCAMENVAGSNYFLAGAQDNGSHQFFNVGVNSTNEITGGDGSFSFIDQDDSNIQITSTVYNSYIITQDFWESGSRASLNGRIGRFINPADYNSNTNTLFAAGNDNSLVRYVIETGQDPFPEQLNINIREERISSLNVSPFDDNVMVIGTGSGGIFILEEINGTPTTTNIDGEGLEDDIYISSVAYGSSSDHIIATASNYGVVSVYETLDGGATWSNKEGNLPDFPVRWALPNPNNFDEVLLATELGVWYADDFSADNPTWIALNDGLANVRCDMLQYREADGLVAVATHGRGLYTSDIFATTSVASFKAPDIAYVGNSISFEDGSIKADSYSWSFGDGTSSTDINPTHVFESPGTYTVQLTIDGDETKSFSKTIAVLPNLSSSFSLADGGDFETNTNFFYPATIAGTGFELGESSISGKDGTNSGTNAWVTGLDQSTYDANGEAYLYTPLYDFNLSGDYKLEFFTKYEIEDEWEGFILEYSTDYGRSWRKLGDFLDEENWYNQNAISSAIAFAPGEPIFSGDTGGEFLKKSIVFSDLSAQDVGFRFVFKTDPGTEEAGLAIDDFSITPPEATAAAVSFDASTTACRGDVIRFTNTSTGSIESYSWDFGPNATPANAQGFGPHDVVFTTTGIQNVVLTANTSSGDLTEEIVIQVSESPASVEIDQSSIEVCSGDPFSLTLDSETGLTYFLFSINDASVVGDGIAGTGESISLTADIEVGVYDFRILVRNEGDCESLSVQPFTVNVVENPVAEITQRELKVLISTLGDSYQWYLNGNPIEDSNDFTLIISEAGIYSVEVSRGSCSTVSEDFVVTSVLNALEKSEITVYPNPADAEIEVSYPGTDFFTVSILDQSGSAIILNSSKKRHNIEDLSEGVYFVVVSGADGSSSTHKFVKRKQP